MKLRIQKPKDKKKIVRILKIILPFLASSTIWKIFHGEREKNEFLVIEKKKKFLGTILVSSVCIWGLKLLYLKAIGIEKSQQGKGTGRKALKLLEEKAQKEKTDILWLLSNPTRTKAHKFYEKNKFKKFLGFLFWKKL